jgi:hypothetical protein
MIAQASEIDRATVRSCFLYRAAADKFFSGFRRLQCHAAEESGGPKFYPLSPLAALSAAFFFAARAAREAGEKISQGCRPRMSTDARLCATPMRG